MKKFLLATTLMAGFIGTAHAADLATRKSPMPAALPVMAQYNWSGFYVGIQGGGGFGGDSRHRAPGARSGSIEMSGGLIGGTLGYNHQIGNFVAGIEGDYAWSSLKGSTAVNCVPNCKTDIRSFGTLRGRLGYSFDRILPYVTGGLAVADIRHAAGPFTGSDFRAGWTLGAGVEAALTRNITAKAEYLYYDFARETYNSAAGISANTNGHIIRAGLNYKF